MLETVRKAKDGDAKALEAIVRSIQDQVHRLALRMLADVSFAEDATQDILVRIVTKLSTFKGESKFETWVYRVAMNHLLTATKIRDADPGLSFEVFEEDLLTGLSEPVKDAIDQVALNELRIKCTMAMLLCLDANHRAAYVLGDILEMDHIDASAVLDVSPRPIGNVCHGRGTRCRVSQRGPAAWQARLLRAVASVDWRRPKV